MNSFYESAIAAGPQTCRNRTSSKVELNDATHFNALDVALVSDLARALEQLAFRTYTCSIVLQAAGPHFCIGANPYERSSSSGSFLAMAKGLCTTAQHCCELRVHLGPTITTVHGHLVGGGIALALNASYMCAPPRHAPVPCNLNAPNLCVPP